MFSLPRVYTDRFSLPRVYACSKYLLHNNLLKTYLSMSTRYQDQPGTNFSDSKGHSGNISTMINSPVLKDTESKSQPGLTPRF